MASAGIMTTDNPPKRPVLRLPSPSEEVSQATIKAAITPQAEIKAPLLPDSDEKPPRHPPRIPTAPSIRQLYWCDFPHDGHLPEFWKRRPVLIISFKNILSGAVTVIPCSSQDQTGNKWAYKLTTTIDGADDSWAICDKPTTVAVSRLTSDKNGVRRLPVEEFNQILSLLLTWLPKL